MLVLSPGNASSYLCLDPRGSLTSASFGGSVGSSDLAASESSDTGRNNRLTEPNNIQTSANNKNQRQDGRLEAKLLPAHFKHLMITQIFVFWSKQLFLFLFMFVCNLWVTHQSHLKCTGREMCKQLAQRTSNASPSIKPNRHHTPLNGRSKPHALPLH